MEIKITKFKGTIDKFPELNSSKIAFTHLIHYGSNGIEPLSEDLINIDIEQIKNHCHVYAKFIEVIEFDQNYGSDHRYYLFIYDIGEQVPYDPTRGRLEYLIDNPDKIGLAHSYKDGELVRVTIESLIKELAEYNSNSDSM